MLRTRNTEEKLVAINVPPIKIQLQGLANSESSKVALSDTTSQREPTDCEPMNLAPSNNEDSAFLPPAQEGYKLMFAPSNAYMFIKFFHALYERITYAKVLIKEKLEADLAEMGKEEKQRLEILKDGKLN